MRKLPYQKSTFNFRGAQTPRVSLSVSVYQRVDFFAKVLASLEIQTFKDFEILICDDGSSPAASQAFQKLAQASGIATQYFWQPDQGFCKNEILNKGILHARSEIMVFIDGDCVLHPSFIEDHVRSLKPGEMLAGRRVNLTQQVSQMVTPDRIRKNWIQNNFAWILPLISWEKDNNGPKGLRFENPILLDLLNRKPRGIVGSNFSIYRSDLFKVNGFDSRYSAPGTGEDSDLEWRLHQVGVKTKPFLHQGIQYHLWHKLQNRNPVTEELFAQTRKLGQVITAYGLEELKTAPCETTDLVVAGR